MVGKRIRIKISDFIKFDYSDLKKRWYKGTIVGRHRKEDMKSAYGTLENRAYKVRLVGEKEPRVFFEDEIEDLK